MEICLNSISPSLLLFKSSLLNNTINTQKEVNPMPNNNNRKVPEYIKNLGKSMKYAVDDVTRDMFPSIAEFKESNSDTIKSVVDMVKNRKQLIHDTHRHLTTSDVYKAVDRGKKNIFDDLKSGKLYNKDRMGSDSEGDFDNLYGGMGNDLGFDMNDFNFDSFDDDSGSSKANIVVVNQGVGNKAMAAATSGIAKSTLMSADMIVRNQRAQHATDMAFNMKAFNNINANLGNVTNAIVSISEFNNNVTKSFYDASTAYYTKSSQLLEEQVALMKESVEMSRNLYRGALEKYEPSKSREKSAMNDVILSEGGLDLSAYGKHLTKNLKEAADMMGLGMLQAGSDMAGGPVAMLDELFKSPMKFLPKALVKTFIPKDFKSASKSLDNNFRNWATAALLRINEGEDDWENPVRQTLSKIFGVKLDNKSNVNLADYHKGAAAFDGVTRKAIIEVIPGYLAKILSTLSNQEEMVFNYESGSFSKKSDIIKAYDSVRQSMMTTDVEDSIRDVLNYIQIKDAEDAKKLNTDIKKYIKYYADKGRLPSRKEDYYEHAMDMDLEGGSQSFDMIKEAFFKANKEAQMTFADDIVSYRKRQADRIEYLTKTMDISGISASLNDSIFDRNKFKGGVGSHMQDAYGKTQLDYLRDITDALYTGIIVYPTSSSSRNFKIPSTVQSRKLAFDNATSAIRAAKDAEILGLATSRDKADERQSASVDAKIKNNPNTAFTVLGSLYEGDGQDVKAAAELNERLMGYMDEKYGVNKKGTFVQKLFKNNKIYQAATEFNRKIKESAINPFNIVKKSMEILSGEIYKSIYGTDEEDGESKNPVKRLIGKVQGDILNPIAESFKTKIFEPLEYHLFDKENGLIPKFNKFLDEKVFNRFKGWFGDSIFGKTLKGGTDKVKDFFAGKDNPNSVFSNMKSMFFDGIYKPFMTTLFGEQIDKITSDGKVIKIRKGDGLVSDVKDEFKNLFKGLNRFVFGDKADKSEVTSGRLAEVFKNAKMDVPKFVSGAGFGILGSLFLPGGPLLGAAIGGFGSLASKSDSFRKLLFGDEKNEGMFKKEWGDWFKEKFPKFTASASLGVVGSLFLPGGPLLGAVVGTGIQWAKQSESFQKYMFGETNPDGTVKTEGLIKKEWMLKFKALLPAGIAGSMMGGVALGGPFGLAIGAILGSTLKHLSSMDKFQNFLFGEKDEDGKRKGGIRGEIVKVINNSIATPLKEKFKSIKLSFNDWFTKNIGQPFKNGLDPFIKEISLIGTQIKEGFSNVFKSIGDKFNEAVTKPISDLLEEKMLKPMRKVLDKIFNRIGNIIGAIISAPFKAFSNMGDTLRKDHIKKKNATYMTEEEIEEFKRNSNPFTRFFMGLSEKRPNSILGKAFAKGRERGDGIANSLSGSRNSAVGSVNGFFNAFSSLFNRGVPYGTPKVTPKGKSDEAEITISAGDETLTDGTGGSNKAKIQIKQFSKVLAGTAVLMAKFTGPTVKANKKTATDNQAELALDADDTTKSADASVSGRSKVRGKFSVRDMGSYLKSISIDTAKIRGEVDGQLDGSGYNLELISNILVDQFGSPSWLPTKLKRGVRGNYKRQGFLEKFTTGIKTHLFKPMTGMFSMIFKPVFMLGDALKATGSALLEVGKEVLMLPIDIFKFGLTAIKTFAEGTLEVVKAFGPAVGEVLKGFGQAAGLTLNAFGHVIEAGGYAFAETLRGVTTVALDLGLGIGHLAAKGIPFALEKMYEFGEGVVNITGKLLGFVGKVTTGAISMGGNFIGGIFHRGRKTLEENGMSASGKVTRVIIEGGKIDNVVNIEEVRRVKEIEKVSNIVQFNPLTDKFTDPNSPLNLVGTNRRGTGARRTSGGKGYTRTSTGQIMVAGSSALQLTGPVNALSDIIDVDYENVPNVIQLPSTTSKVGQNTADNIIAKDVVEAQEKRDQEMLDLTRRNTAANEGAFDMLFKKGKNLWDNIKALVTSLPALLGGFGKLLPLLGALPFILDKLFGKDGKGSMTEAANGLIEGTPVEDYFDRAPGILGRRVGKFGVKTGVKFAGKIGEEYLAKGGLKLGAKVANFFKDGAIDAIDKMSGTKVGKAVGKVVDNSTLLTKVKDALLNVLTSPSVASKIGGEAVGKQIAEEVVEKGLRKAPKLLAKLGVKLASYGVGIGIVIDAVFFMYDFNKGLMNVANIWKIDSEIFEPSHAMLISAGLGQAISGLLLGIPEPGWLASIIYKALGVFDTEDQKANLRFSQENLKTKASQYNEMSGENLSLDQYNDRFNKQAGFKQVMGSLANKSLRFGTSMLGLNSFTGALNNDKIMSTFGLEDKSSIKLSHRVASGFGNQVNAMTFGVVDAEKASHLAMGGLQSIGTAFSKMGGFIKDMPEHISNIGEWIGGIGTGIGKFAKGKFDAVKEFGSKTYDKIKDPLEAVLKVLYLPQYMVNKTMTNIKEAISPTINKWIDDFSGWFSEKYTAIATVVGQKWNDAKAYVGEKWDILAKGVSEWMSGVGTFISTNYDKLKEGVSKVGKVAWDKTKEIASSVFDVTKDAMGWVNDSIVQPVWNKYGIKAVQKIKDAGEWVGDVFSGFGKTIKSAYDFSKDWVTTKVKDAMTGVKDFFTEVIDFGKGIGEAINDFFEFDKYFNKSNSIFNKDTRTGSFGQGKPQYGMGRRRPRYGMGNTIESDSNIKSVNVDKDGYKGAVNSDNTAVVNEVASETYAPKSVFYSQYDGRWKDHPFTTSGDKKKYTVGEAGCGPTAAAMVASTMTGKAVTPDIAARFAIEGGFKEVDGGTMYDFFPKFASQYKLNAITGEAGTGDANDKILAALSNGAPTILMGKGGKLFGKNPHYVVATGYQDGRIYINDPASRTPNQSFMPSEILPYATKAFFHQKDATRGGVSGILDVFQGMINSLLGGGAYQGLASESGLFTMMSGDVGEGLYNANVPSPDVKINFNPEGWMSGDLDAQPWLMERVKLMAKSFGKKIYVTSGYRSYAEQKRLWDEAASKYPDPKERAKWVAEPRNPPNIGSHRIGMAIDLNTSNTWLRDVDQSILAQYGLWRPLDWESWHYEPLETGYPNLDTRARMIGSGEMYNRYGYPQDCNQGDYSYTANAGTSRGATTRTSTTPASTTNVVTSRKNVITSDKNIKKGNTTKGGLRGNLYMGMGKGNPFKSTLDKIKYGMGPKASINNFSSYNDGQSSNAIRTSLVRERIIASNPGMSSGDIETLVALLMAIAENTSAIVDNTNNMGDITVVTPQGSGQQGNQNQQSSTEQNNKAKASDRSHFTNLGKKKPQPINKGISTIAKGRKL